MDDNNKKYTSINQTLDSVVTNSLPYIQKNIDTCILIHDLLLSGVKMEPVLSLAAAMSVQSPFKPHARRDPECQTALKNLENDHGDPFTLLGAYRCGTFSQHSVSFLNLSYCLFLTFGRLHSCCL